MAWLALLFVFMGVTDLSYFAKNLLASQQSLSRFWKLIILIFYACLATFKTLKLFFIKLANYFMVTAKPGKSYWRGRLSTVDLLIKVGCFVMKENKVSEWKGADINKEVNRTKLSPSVRLPWPRYVQGETSPFRQAFPFKSLHLPENIRLGWTLIKGLKRCTVKAPQLALGWLGLPRIKL